MCWLRNRKRLRFAYRIGRTRRKKGVPMLELICTNEEKIHVTVNPVTTAGQPCSLDGPIAIVTQSGDGSFATDGDLSFWLISGDNPGDTTFIVSGDADLGTGTETISEIIVLHVSGAKAKNLGLVAESPVPK